MAASRRRSLRHHRIVFAAQIKSAFILLEAAVQCMRSRVADDVASAGEKQVDVLVQLQATADVERYVGMAIAFLR